MSRYLFLTYSFFTVRNDEVEGKAPVTFTAGGVLFIPAGKVHSAKNFGTTNAAELATYIVEKGKPLVFPKK